jgi:hypothetical protein
MDKRAVDIVVDPGGAARPVTGKGYRSVTFIRLRLVAFAVAVLACQGAALSAAPVALCRGALSLPGDLDECCKRLAPGQVCPMHHTTHGAPKDRGPAWACICSPSDAVLASIAGVGGTLPAPVLLSYASAVVVAVTTSSSSTLERQQPPTSPPPRLSRDFSRL